MSDLKNFRELVGESLGRASVAWSETPVGIFDSETCSELYGKIVAEHEKLQAENKEMREALERIRNEDWGTDCCDAKNMIADEVLSKIKGEEK